MGSASDGPVSFGPLEEEDAKKVVGGDKEEDLQEKKEKSSKNNNGDLGLEEASFGENILDFEGRERWVFFSGFIFIVSLTSNLSSLH